MNLTRLETFANETRARLEEVVANQLARVLNPESVARRTSPDVVKKLEDAVRGSSARQIVEQTAYEWFNRFCALRFLDVHRYGRVNVLSPVAGQNLPEILAEAQSGVYPDSLSPERREEVVGLFTGRIQSHDGFNAVYRILFLNACNDWNRQLPFLFESVADYTELLLPDDLLSQDSIPARVIEALDAESCEHVEVIGWLYQFYVSRQKDKVFEGLKKNKKIEKENIPAATELFTPNWIVKYLVQNSLGQLLVKMQPTAGHEATMRYFVPEEPLPAQPLPRLEELKVCDPCCGSGHMLVEAFELLFAAYEKAGYETLDIPRLILENNLYGMDLDPRAAALASFCLMMKVLEHDHRFFKRRERQAHPLVPQVLGLRAYSFAPGEISDYRAAAGDDLFSRPVLNLMNIFADADTFGSLLSVSDIPDESLIQRFRAFNNPDDLFTARIHADFLKALRQAEFLTPRYHVVVTNPPYMGSKGMNTLLSDFAKAKYPDSKSDLFAMFIERCLTLARPDGYAALVTMQSWMFLSSYENLRKRLLREKTIMALTHMGNMVMRIAFGTSAMIFRNSNIEGYRGAYCYVDYADLDDNGIPTEFPPDNARNRFAERRE